MIFDGRKVVMASRQSKKARRYAQCLSLLKLRVVRIAGQDCAQGQLPNVMNYVSKPFESEDFLIQQIRMADQQLQFFLLVKSYLGDQLCQELLDRCGEKTSVLDLDRVKLLYRFDSDEKQRFVEFCKIFNAAMCQSNFMRALE